MRTRILASVTLWLVAVASVAAIAWLAIDAAGRQVTSVQVAASLPSAGSGTPTQTPSAGSTTDGGGAPASASPTTIPATPAKTQVKKGAPASTPTSASTSSGAPSVARSGPVVAGSYTTAAGRVRVTCRGRTITLDGGYAQPAPGWSVRVQSGGPMQVQVVFELGDQQALLVVGVCADGRPQFDQDRIEAGSPPTTGQH